MFPLVMIEPDIPQNCGAMLRLAACFGVPLHLVEPFGFVWDPVRVKKVAMDYAGLANTTRHPSWQAFQASHQGARRLLLTTKGAVVYDQFAFQPGDMLLLGRESAGVPEAVHQAATARLFVPLHKQARSLNVVVAAAMVLGEALRQMRQQGRGE